MGSKCHHVQIYWTDRRKMISQSQQNNLIKPSVLLMLGRNVLLNEPHWVHISKSVQVRLQTATTGQTLINSSIFPSVSMPEVCCGMHGVRNQALAICQASRQTKNGCAAFGAFPARLYTDEYKSFSARKDYFFKTLSCRCQLLQKHQAGGVRRDGGGWEAP